MSELVAVRLSDARSSGGFRPRVAAGASQAAAVAEPVIEPGSDPFEQGYRQGLADAGQAFAEERNQLIALLAACEALRPEPSEGLALHIAEAVETLVRLIAGSAALATAFALAVPTSGQTPAASTGVLDEHPQRSEPTE